MLKLAIPFLALVAAAPTYAASIDGNLTLGCQDLSTHNSMRLSNRMGDTKAADDEMRRALKSGACGQMPDNDRVSIKERSGLFVCVKGTTTAGRCEWVEAKEVRP